MTTNSDSAAAEPCPYWPGGPVQVHRGYPDPFNAPEADKAAASALTREAIGDRMLQLLQLPLDPMKDDELPGALAALAHR